MKETIVRNKKRHEVTSALKLPHLISDVESIYIIPYQIDEPNFITTNTFSGYLTYISNDASKVELENKIVLIENADPGFDWIFSHNIGGLITKFGGANSHMAIRCFEFGVPAAIGCGEVAFENIKTFSRVKIDCLARLITEELE